jgi:hypothetical protein
MSQKTEGAQSSATAPEALGDFPAFPGFKHYAAVNDKGEITDKWSSGPNPGRIPAASDVLLRENGGWLPYLIDPATDGPLSERVLGGDVYRYRISNGLIAAKAPDEIAAEAEALRVAALPGEIREKRNRLLDEADKMLFEWRPMADEKREEWRAYMQELRDLTKQPGFPVSVEWPAEPE